MAKVNVANFTFWHGGKVIFWPKLQYKDGESINVKMYETQFVVDSVVAMIRGMGYDDFKIRYVPSMGCLPTELVDVVDMDDFKKLKEVAFSIGYINIIVVKNVMNAAVTQPLVCDEQETKPQRPPGVQVSNQVRFIALYLNIDSSK